MSYGGNEASSDPQTNNLYTTPAGHVNVTYLSSTGDTGSPAGNPAYAPTVVGVGGTFLTVSGNTYVSESGWSGAAGVDGSGGGISLYQSKPAYQSSVTQSSTKRTLPDVSFDADPNSGVAIYDSYDFSAGTPWIAVGGTSFSSPAWAGIIAIANQGRATNGLSSLDGVTQTLPLLYSISSSDFHDITSGNNGFAAGVGYDLVTGRGTPIAPALINDLATPAIIVNPGAVSYSTLASTYSQNFNTLASSGSTSSSLPTGWSFAETGSSGNTTYGIDNGGSSSGNTYSYGTTASTDRALGGLQTSSVVTTFGVAFQNLTGAPLNSVSLAYTGEQWRLGATGRTDRLDFQYSLDATTVDSGTWTDFNSLDFTAPVTSGSLGAKDGNAAADRTAKSATISALNIPNGNSIWFRWVDFNATGSDDGLAVDDLTFVANTAGNVAPTTTGQSSASVVTGNTFAFSGANAFSIADPDSSSITETLHVTAGSLAVTTGSTTVTGNGTGNLTVTGTVTTVNTALATLVYTSPNAVSTVTLSASGNDGVATGNTVTTTIHVTNVAPTTSGPTSGTVAWNSQLSFSGASAFSVADPDSANVTAFVTTSVGAVSVTASGASVSNITGGISIAGTLANVNTALGTLIYSAPSSGTSATLTVNASDSVSTSNSVVASVTLTAPNVINYTALNSTYLQNFDSLASSGTSSTLPNGWFFSETGSNANTTYSADNGSLATGNTYSYGATGSTERALGQLRNGGLASTIGANILNNTGSLIGTFTITYTGEQWRIDGAHSVVPDGMSFEYSLNATSLSSGNWTPVTSLDFASPVTGSTFVALNGNIAPNRTVGITGTISGLNLANAASFWIRWVDTDATGADDGLAIDDFSFSASGVPPDLTITNTNDSLSGSLRQAILRAYPRTQDWLSRV
jgi:hypothetical protein